MKKYSWSLNKCLEFINAKKEGLEIRNNYLAQMQELEKRMMSEVKLSLSWNEIKNEEDLILANTFYNAKKIEFKGGQPEKKSNNKRVGFAEVLVQRPNAMIASHASGMHHQPSKTAKKPKSILRGDTEV
jgi:hypothetical protein